MATLLSTYSVHRYISLLGSVYTNSIFSVGCNSRIQRRTKDRKNPIFCAVSDAAVASDTENHCLCKQTIRYLPSQVLLTPYLSVPT
jgi:hypothetical protein